MNDSVPKYSRSVSLDIIRLIATFAVIMIHTSGPFATAYPVSSPQFVFGNIFNGISRIGVPLFLMISGALMLDESKSITHKKMLKAAFTLLLLLWFWSAFYSVWHCLILPLLRGESANPGGLAGQFAEGHYHLWYLKIIIGIYIITPLLRLFVKKENAAYIFWFLTLSFAVKFALPMLSIGISRYFSYGYLISIHLQSFNFDYLTSFLTYYILGWYICQIGIPKKYNWLVYCGGLMGALLTILPPLFLSTDTNTVSDQFFSESSVNIFLYSLSVFLFVFNIFENKHLCKGSRALAFLSKISFGVYLIHPFFLERTSHFIEGLNNPLLTITAIFFIVATVSFAASAIISKIPFLKKLIKC